jgi:hypothetical protein
MSAFLGNSHATPVHAVTAPGATSEPPPIQGASLDSAASESVPRDFTTQELQLSGACDWYKLSRLVESENKLIKILHANGMDARAKDLENMRDDVLAHRMANSPFQSYKVFYRSNCANDAYISKWRHDIDAFVKSLRKAVGKAALPEHASADIVYLSQLLRQQAKVSLPYTGFYDPVPKSPIIPAGTFRDIPYKPRFILDRPPELSRQSIDISLTSLSLCEETQRRRVNLSSFL